MTRPAARRQQVRLRFWCCVGEASFESLRDFISCRQVVDVDAGEGNDDEDGGQQVKVGLVVKVYRIQRQLMAQPGGGRGMYKINMKQSRTESIDLLCYCQLGLSW